MAGWRGRIRAVSILGGKDGSGGVCFHNHVIIEDPSLSLSEALRAYGTLESIP